MNRPLIQEMNREELLIAKKEFERLCLIEWKSWRGRSKAELVAEISRHYRIHGHSVRDTMDDLKAAIVTVKFGSTLARIEKRLKKLAEVK